MTLLESYKKDLKAQSENILLTEDWGTPTEVMITEDTSGEPEYIQGVFMQAEVKNKNGRVYPKSVLEKAVEEYMAEHEGKLRLGELDHPPRLEVDPLEAAIHIEDLWWEGNNVMGRAKILRGDGHNGDHLYEMIKAGIIPGVSSRGGGQVVDGVVRKFHLTAPVDVVLNPSAPDAYVSVI